MSHARNWILSAVLGTAAAVAGGLPSMLMAQESDRPPVEAPRVELNAVELSGVGNEAVPAATASADEAYAAIPTEPVFIIRPNRRPNRPGRNEWRLGVHADRTNTGMVITQVIRGGAAERAGLERGDRIVAVGGQQVGMVDGRYRSIRNKLQQLASGRGDVTLLIQNRRNRNLVNVSVRLDSAQSVPQPFGVE